MPGLLSYSYDDLKSGAIKLREDGTMIPPEDNAPVIIRKWTKTLNDGLEITWTDAEKEKILSCFPKPSSKVKNNQRGVARDLIILCNQTTTNVSKNELVFRVHAIKFSLPLSSALRVYLRDDSEMWELFITLTVDDNVTTGKVSSVTSNVLASQYNTFIRNVAKYTANYPDPLGRYNFKEQHQLTTTISQTGTTLNSTGTAIMNNLIKSSKLMAFAMILEDSADIEYKIFTLSRYLWLASVTDGPTPYEWVFETADKNQMIVIRTNNSEILWAAYIDKPAG